MHFLMAGCNPRAVDNHRKDGNLQSRKITVAVCAGALLLLSLALTGPVTAATPVRCGAVITVSTTLNADLGPCSGNGLVVRASGITVNLDGHTISAKNKAAETAGVLLDHVTGTTVQSGTVTGFDAGVHVDGGSGNTITAISAVNNMNDNINSKVADQCMFGDGIILTDSDTNTVSANTANHNGPYAGISLVGDSDGNTVQNNNVYDSNVPNTAKGGGVGTCGPRPIQDIGIRMAGPGADNNVVRSNRVVNSAVGGITIHGYVFCPPLEGGGCGSAADQNTGNLIQYNYVADTGRDTYTQEPAAFGIGVLREGAGNVVGVSQGNTIANNTIVRSYRDGIFLGNPTQPGPKAGNVVVGNTISDSLFDGIRVPAGAVNNTIDGNTASSSGDVDGRDDNLNCDNNLWTNNVFNYVNTACVSATAAVK